MSTAAPSPRTRAGIMPGGEVVTAFPVNCRPRCGHTAEEHAAFDTGLAHATAGKPDDCPHDSGPLATAWRAGWTTGNLNLRHASK